MIKYNFPKIYQSSVSERLGQLEAKKAINQKSSARLLSGKNLLNLDQADRMIENVVGVFGLPIGLGLNFLVNQKEYLVPMVVEEPSIVAAASSAAKTIRKAGGFSVRNSEMLLIGQIVVYKLTDPITAGHAVMENKNEILNLANSLHPRMVARGGGAIDIEINFQRLEKSKTDLLTIHLLVDSKNAMGANLVNSMCEGVAAIVEKITGGKVFLKILSNLYDRSIIRAEATIPPHLLAGKNFAGDEIRDRIVMASEFAAVDPYRAATHNKGIMNGVDAVAIATGNDWRAIEAAAHAYASDNSGYRALSSWSVDSQSNLVGRLELPLKVGIVGGSLQSNPTVKDLLDILQVQSARELADVMGAVGLAQNFAALRALVSDGIQQGHMTLHARSVAAAAGVRSDQSDEVVAKLIASGEIKVWKAKQIMAEQNNKTAGTDTDTEDVHVSSANGKIILLGEHAVVYGRHALAMPIPQAIKARVSDGDEGVQLIIPRWGIDTHWLPNIEHHLSIYRAIDQILTQLELVRPAIRIILSPQLPRAVGLGSSAAAAVAIIRALSHHFQLNLDDRDVNRIAYESEKIIHGTPSGIDNYVATYAKPILFKSGNPPIVKELSLASDLTLIIGYSEKESLTAKMVEQVSSGWLKNTVQYENWFDAIDALALSASEAIQEFDYQKIGALMNKNQKLLEALRVSSSEQNKMVQIALDAGALGAKMTGAGGGGAIVTLCPEKEQEVVMALEAEGYQTLKPHNLPDTSKDKLARVEQPINVSDRPEERLIVVNENDEVLDFLPRSLCHEGDGLLHRAFSVHIFNSRNQILLQQRSANKDLWPLYWSNSCCSHPRVGEININAAKRRLREELGISAPLQYLYKFKYQARYSETYSEYEMCSVYIGHTDKPIHADAREVAAWRFVDLDMLDHELKEHPERFTPWFKMQWKKLRHELGVIERNPLIN
ncbi:MAG: hydroxymethylglutaryl-CoA reductase, degradative [Desulfobacterales bacterium]|nr:hydroxymethylglutaryl-CoA reductase, degradative [Desulfobacterales bacterium]